MQQVLVIGGGPAGLTAAWRLREHGYAVTLLERRSELGGRLAVSHPVLLGDHEATLSLLERLGSLPRALRSAEPPIEFLLPGGRTVRLRRPPLPAPLHTLVSLATFQGLSAGDRWRLLNLLERAWEGESVLPEDLESRTAEDWLAASGQSEAARTGVWAPLTRFLTGGEPASVSAASLVTPLVRWLVSSRRLTRVVVPAVGADELLIRPLRERLLRDGVAIRTDAPVVQIDFDSHRVSGLRLAGGVSLTADWYVAAVPPRDLTPLLPERAVARFSYFQQLTNLTDTPALTVEFRLENLPPPPRLLLLPGRSFHWMVASATRLSLVAMGRPDLLERRDDELEDLARGVVEDAYPTGPDLDIRACRIVRTPHARLLPVPGAAALRPLPQSPFPNLFLAGDWTDTGLPSTLESAVRSGEQCARTMVDKTSGPA